MCSVDNLASPTKVGALWFVYPRHSSARSATAKVVLELAAMWSTQQSGDTIRLKRANTNRGVVTQRVGGAVT